MGAVLVPLQIAAARSEGLASENISKRLRSECFLYLGENSLHLGDGIKTSGGHEAIKIGRIAWC